MRNIYALLVGIDEYSPFGVPKQVPSLKGCKNDIQAIATYLTEQIDTQSYQLNLKQLCNEEAKREAIIKGFETHLYNAKEDDIALFYYSGHGGQEKAPKEFWHLEPDHLDETLVCYDSRDPGNHDLADKELRYLFAQVAKKNPRIIVILDCCHSGSGTRNIPQGVRLAPEDSRDRDLSSFVFHNNEPFKNLLLGHHPTEVKKRVGLDLSEGRHILLAACRDYQYAKEYPGDEKQNRGAFSYFLLKSLEQANGSLSYLDLARNVEALVKGKVQDQVPQLEASNPEDLKEAFLGGAIPERPLYFNLTYSKKASDHGWAIDGGAIHGIPKLIGEPTVLAIFEATSNLDDLRQLSKARAEAKVTKVLTDKSKVDIEIGEGQEDLDKEKGYWAIVKSLPLARLKVYIQEDLSEGTGIALAKEALEGANFGQGSLYVKQVESSTEADYKLLVNNGQYWITQDERPVIAPIPQKPEYTQDEKPEYTENAAKEAIQALEAIARWTNILNLKSAGSSIKSDDVELEIIEYGHEDEQGNITLCENEASDHLPSTFSENCLAYKYEDGEWKRPVVKVRLTNHSKQKLFCSVLLLSSDYSVEPRIHYYPDPENPEQYEEKTMVLSGTEAEGSNIFESFVYLQIEEEALNKGITEERNIFKLIVSKTDFNADLLQQDGLEPPPQSRSSEGCEGTLDSLMLKASTRSGAGPRKQIDDWMTKEVAVTILKPRDAEQLQPGKGAKLLNGLIEVEPHDTLQAQVTLTTVSQTTRDIGNLIVPPAVWDEQGVIESFQFTTSRGSDPGLGAVELLAVNDVSCVTESEPLTLLVNQALEEDEYLLPVSYDGEFFLPLGQGVKEGKQTKITLERLPQPTTSSRSLTGSIKIFFKKLRNQRLRHAYEYPILAAVEVREEGNQIKVTYQKEPEDVKRLVASAQKIVLYIHGIIGDTESMVGSIQRATVEVNGQRRSLGELYDLVLAFDYENLQTTIEENAQLLKQQLEAVGLGANHGKELHIVAHSMGGLVSRWFIEQEGGNQIVQHLVMLGTPNGGSPWPAIQDMAWVLLGWGLNQIPEMAWPAKVVADLAAKSLKFVEANDNALDQMQPDSPFFKAIANSPDPQVPYTIIAGDRSLSTSQSPERLKRLMAKLLTPALNKVVDDWAFGGEANDIAVSLNSIQRVSDDRLPQPKKNLPNVACDHLTYFTTEAGLKALADALYP